MANESENQNKHDHGHGHMYVIFVGDIREEWRQDNVLASDIMAKADVADPTGFILEALDRKNGKAVAEFQPNEMVNLTDKDRKFFRITPGGGGFS